MTSAQIRQSFLDFFREKQHTIVPVVLAPAGFAEPAFHERGHEPVRARFFSGNKTRPGHPPRTADTQKCIRAGGKHNDLDDVGLDTYHHTFFEMLGNWSFGDYFKKEAIEWAWELVVERWGLPPQRLYATVYKPGPNEPSEFDQEAHDHWARLFDESRARSRGPNRQRQQEGQLLDDGRHRPVRSLLRAAHRSDAAGDTKGALVNAGDARCIEIWNLVFIQFNANADGTFVPLPATSRRYRHGLRARHRDDPGHEKFHRFLAPHLELRDRCLPSDLRRDRKAERKTLRLHAARKQAAPARTSRRKSTSPSASSPITSAPSASPSPTASSRATKAAATFCAASCAALSATVARSVFTSRSSSSWSTSSCARWAMSFPKLREKQSEIERRCAAKRRPSIDAR